MLASCGDSAAAPEKTFIWMPAKSGLAVFSTCGSTLDTVLYVRQDSCGGTELACNDDACGVASRITQSVTAGRTYVVVVDGFGAGPGGAFTLTVTPPP